MSRRNSRRGPADPTLTVSAAAQAVTDAAQDLNAKHTRALADGVHQEIDLEGLTQLGNLTAAGTQTQADARLTAIRIALSAHMLGVGTASTDGEHLAADTALAATLNAIPAPDGVLATAITLFNGIFTAHKAHGGSLGAHFHDDLQTAIDTVTTNPPVTLAQLCVDLDDVKQLIQTHLAIGQPNVVAVTSANADGSIVVRDGSVIVGILATDAQHGVRGGGTQHPAAVSGGANGFLTGADKALLDAIPAGGTLATKAYVDAVAQGLSPKQSVKYATTAALSANAYVNGALGVGATLIGTAPFLALPAQDGAPAPVVGDRILVKNEVAGANNGIYVVTVVGVNAVTPYTLTRALDADTAADLAGAFVFVEDGTANADLGYVLPLDASLVVGTTPIAWVQFSGAGEITVTAPLAKSGNALSIVAATGSLPGSMSAADKTKSDRIPVYLEVGNANKTTGVSWQTLLTSIITGPGTWIFLAKFVPSSTSFSNYIHFRLKVDGNVIAPPVEAISYADNGVGNKPALIDAVVTALAAGDHTVLIEWKDAYDAATAHINGNSDPNWEYGSILAVPA